MSVSAVWIKALCSLAVIAGCGYAGIVYASRYDVRINQIRGLITAFRALEFEICMNNSVLPDALRRAGEAGGAVSGGLFASCADKIENSTGETANSIWCSCVKNSELCLDDSTIKMLCEFGITLGGGNRDAEKANICSAVLRLQNAEKAAEEIKKKNAGLYRSLGFAAGILIAVLLL